MQSSPRRAESGFPGTGKRCEIRGGTPQPIRRELEQRHEADDRFQEDHAGGCRHCNAVDRTRRLRRLRRQRQCRKRLDDLRRRRRAGRRRYRCCQGSRRQPAGQAAVGRPDRRAEDAATHRQPAGARPRAAAVLRRPACDGHRCARHSDAAHHQRSGRPGPERLRGSLARDRAQSLCRVHASVVRKGDGAAIGPGRGRIVRPCRHNGLRRPHRHRDEQPGAACVRGAGGQPGTRAGARSQFRVLRRGPVPHGNHGGGRGEGDPGEGPDRDGQAPGGQRAGNEPPAHPGDDRSPGAARALPAAVRDGGEGRQDGLRHVRLQLRQRRAFLREQGIADRRAAQRLGLHRLRAVGLLRRQDHRRLDAGGHGP